MKDVIITIGRLNGSGGRELGKIIAERLGIPLHDSDVVAKAAKDIGISDDDAYAREERRSNKTTYWGYDVIDPLYDAESVAIKALADKGPCVFVGRSADAVLSERNLLRIFITADEDDCIERSMRRNNISKKEATERVRNRNRDRGSYYQRHTGKIWGLVTNYDLCLNSSKIDLDTCADIVIQYLENMN